MSGTCADKLWEGNTICALVFSVGTNMGPYLMLWNNKTEDPAQQGLAAMRAWGTSQS